MSVINNFRHYWFSIVYRDKKHENILQMFFNSESYPIDEESNFFIASKPRQILDKITSVYVRPHVHVFIFFKYLGNT